MLELCGACLGCTRAGSSNDYPWSRHRNPPPNFNSAAEEIAIAVKATLVPVATFTPILQATLNAQGFRGANNWILVDNLLALDNNATFNITADRLRLNVLGTAFGELTDFTLDPDLAEINPPPGSTLTEHWLQLLHEDKRYVAESGDPFGFAIAGQPGFWQLDNGDVKGGPAAGAGTGPYYASNGGTFIPPMFHDFPRYYQGVGTYLHFDTIPSWDLFSPAMGNIPAMETIFAGDYGLTWGFSIVPEPSTIRLMAVGLLGLVGCSWRRRQGFPSAAAELWAEVGDGLTG